jgi:hypothetical protein
MPRTLPSCLLRPAALAALLLMPGSAISAQDAPTPTLVIRRVSVLPMDRDTLLADRDVLIAGNRIVAIVPAARTAPTGVPMLDGTGKYVIPGLWDAHVHALDMSIEVAQRLVAFGITSVRDMGSLGDSLPGRRAAWQALHSSAPRLFAAGPLIDGPRQRWSQANAWHLTDPSGADVVVDSLARLGADFVKVYNTLSRPSYLALVAAAKRRGLPIVGHLPFTVSTTDAVDVGQRSFEHAGPELVTLDCVADGKARYSRLLGAWGARGYGAYLAGLDTLRGERAPSCTRSLQALLAERGAIIVPTIVTFSKTWARFTASAPRWLRVQTSPTPASCPARACTTSWRGSRAPA